MEFQSGKAGGALFSKEGVKTLAEPKAGESLGQYQCHRHTTQKGNDLGGFF